MHRYSGNSASPFYGAGSDPGPVMEVSGFIMEVLLTLRDIKEQQNVQCGKLSEQIGALRGELAEIKRSIGQRTDELKEVKDAVEMAGDMIYTEQWNPMEYFPIKSVEQLQQLDEISRLAEEHAHFKDLVRADCNILTTITFNLKNLYRTSH